MIDISDTNYWRPIPSLGDGYYASINGEIYSAKYSRMLKQSTDSYGYKRCKSRKVHRLVMEAFIGASDLHVDHLNMVKDDNRLCNLEYVTVKENVRRALVMNGIFEEGQELRVLQCEDGFYVRFKMRNHLLAGPFESSDSAVEFRDNPDYDRLSALDDQKDIDIANQCISEREGKFIVKKVFCGVEYYLGIFDTRKEAFDILHGITEERAIAISESLMAKRKSKYKGVTINGAGHWTSLKTFNGKSYNIGVFDTEEEAKIAHDLATEEWCIERQKLIKESRSSKHKGVAFNKSKKKWEAFIRMNGKHIYLGTYKTEDEAVQARDKGIANYSI